MADNLEDIQGHIIPRKQNFLYFNILSIMYWLKLFHILFDLKYGNED